MILTIVNVNPLPSPPTLHWDPHPLPAQTLPAPGANNIYLQQTRSFKKDFKIYVSVLLRLSPDKWSRFFYARVGWNCHY